MLDGIKLQNLNAKKIGLAISISMLIPPNFGFNIFGINLEDLPLIILFFFLVQNKINNFEVTNFDKYSVFFILFFTIYSSSFNKNFDLINQTNLRFYFYFTMSYLIVDYLRNSNSKVIEIFDQLWIVMLANFLLIIFKIQLPGTIDGWILSNNSFFLFPTGRLGGFQGGGPNVIGIICVLYSLVCLSKIMSSKSKIQYLFENKFNSVLLIISFLNLFLTYSRGSYIALVIGFLVLITLEDSISKNLKYILLLSLTSFILIGLFLAPSILLKQSNRSYLSSLAINNLELIKGTGGGFYIKEVYKDYLITFDKQFLIENYNFSYNDEDIPLHDDKNLEISDKYVEGYLKLKFVYKKGFFPRSVVSFFYSNNENEWNQIGGNFSIGTVIDLIQNDSYFEVGGWADGQSPDDSYLDGFINEVEINISDNKSKYVIDEKNRDLEYNVFLSSSDNFYNNKNDGPLVYEERGLKLLRPRSYWVALPNKNDISRSDFEIILKLSLNDIPKGNETLFSQSSIINNTDKTNDQSWKWSIVDGRMFFFWIENVNDGYVNYLGGQSLRSEKLIINDQQFDKTDSEFTISQYDEITTSHNGFLTMAVEYGAAIVILIVSSLIYLIYKNFNKENKVQLVLIVSLVSQNLTNDLIYAPDVGILFWIIPFCFLSNVVMNR